MFKVSFKKQFKFKPTSFLIQYKFYLILFLQVHVYIHIQPISYTINQVPVKYYTHIGT